MMWMVSALLLALWLLAMVSGHALGAWIHLLLALAVITISTSLLRGNGRDPV